MRYPVCNSGWACTGVLLIDSQTLAIDKNHYKKRILLLSLYGRMKKAILSISVLCYLAVSSGIVINYHYCMKRLVSVHLFENSPSVCGKCGMETHESSGCCRDEVKLVKLQQDQNKIAVASLEIPALELIVSIPSDFIAASFQRIDVQTHCHNHSPPLLSGQDIYLQNNVFRI
jgi:hypothetical protein